MKNTTLIICFLVIVIIFLGCFSYRTQKRLDNVVDNVQHYIYDPLVPKVDNIIRKLEDIKCCPGMAFTKENYQTVVAQYPETSYHAFKSFVLATDMYENERNAKEIDDIKDNFYKQSMSIAKFSSSHLNYSDLKAGDIDTLLSYYKNLENIFVNLKKNKLTGKW